MKYSNEPSEYGHLPGLETYISICLRFLLLFVARRHHDYDHTVTIL